jgi:hypothetical protein
LYNADAFLIAQDNESLARIGSTYFLQLVMTNGTKFNEEMWTSVCAKLQFILNKNSPEEVLKLMDQKQSEDKKDFPQSISSEELMSDSGELPTTPLHQSQSTPAGVTPTKSPLIPGSSSTPNKREHRLSMDVTGAISLQSPLTSSISTPTKRVAQVLRPTQSFEVASKPLTNSTEIQALKKSSQATKPTPPSATKIARGRCTVQLGTIESLNEIAFTHYSHLTTEHLVILLDTLSACYRVNPDQDLLQCIKPANNNATGSWFLKFLPNPAKI